jgi:outer membrane receptor protein involved in Fe transport
VTFNDASISETAEPTIQRAAQLALQSDPTPTAAPTPAPTPTFHVVPIQPGDPVPGVGRYVGRAGIETRPVTRVTAGATLRFSGPFTPSGEPTVRTSPYSVLDLTGTVRLSTDVGLDAELANVLDVRYPEVRASGFLNPGWPRTLRVALRFGAPGNSLLH